MKMDGWWTMIASRGASCGAKLRNTRPFARQAPAERAAVAARTSRKPPLRGTALPLACLALLTALVLSSALWAEDRGVIATVNGQPITEAEFQQALWAQAGARVLVEMIDETLITQAAAQAGVTAAPEVVRMREDSLLAQAGGESGLQALLAQRGLTRERLAQQVRLGVLLDGLVQREMQITDAEIDAYYRDHADRYRRGPQVKARMILTATKENAEALRQALEAGGDFAGLAKPLSNDPATAPKGGDMGWFERQDYAAVISDMAFRLKPGELSPVFQGPDGWYLIKVEDTRPAGERPLAEVRDEIVSAIKFQRLPEARRKWLADRRAAVKVTLADPQVRAAAEQLLQTAPPPGTLTE
jgi:foldase protein PrsA